MHRIPAQPEDRRIMRRHATAVCLQGEGILLLGESGVGKSDLALRLIADGATLIADDRVDIAAIDDALWLSPPASLAGVIEAYGIGLLQLPYVPKAHLRLVVQCDAAAPERLPARRKWIMEGILADEITLDPLHTSTPAKLRLLITALQSGTWLPEDWMADSQHTPLYSTGR